MHTTQYTLNNTHNRPETKHYTPHTAHCTLHTTHCTLNTAYCRLYTAYCMLKTANCILHTEHCKLHTAHGTSPYTITKDPIQTVDCALWINQKMTRAMLDMARGTRSDMARDNVINIFLSKLLTILDLLSLYDLFSLVLSPSGISCWCQTVITG